MKKDQKVAANRVSFLINLLKSRERKTVAQIAREIILLGLKHKCLPNYYFSRRLYQKDILNVNDFIPDQELVSLDARFNNKNAVPLLGNKLFFYLFYSRFSEKIARVLMFNNKNVFIFNNENIKITTPEDFEKLLYKAASGEQAGGSLFIKKTYDSYGGKNIYLLKRSDFPLEKEKLRDFFINITQSGYLFQERIIQHPDLDKLNPSCVNSMRMDTFIDKDGCVDIISPYMRMSMGNTHVDNLSSGGCAVGVDKVTGKLKDKGFTSISKTGGMIIYKHPVTGITFDGFQVPFFKEARELVIYFAGLNPDLRLVGWDVAITPSGPVIIEGNSAYDKAFNDLVEGGLRKNKVFMKVLAEAKEGDAL